MNIFDTSSVSEHKIIMTQYWNASFYKFFFSRNLGWAYFLQPAKLERLLDENFISLTSVSVFLYRSEVTFFGNERRVVA